MEIPPNQSPLFRQIIERLEVTSKSSGCAWIMCPAGHGIRDLRTDLKSYLSSALDSGFAHVDLKYLTNVPNSSQIATTDFLKLLANAWGFDFRECGNIRNEQPYEILNKLIAKARDVHNNLLLQIDNIDKATYVDTRVFSRLREIEENAKRSLAGWEDSKFSTFVVTKWTRRFITEHWESEFREWLLESGYGTNHLESEIKLLTDEDLKDHLGLSDAKAWSISYINNHCGGFYDAAVLFKDSLKISNQSSKLIECCRREESEEGLHELECLLPSVDNVAVKVLKALDPTVGDTTRLDQFYRCYAGLDSIETGFAHPYKDYLLRSGDSRPTDFILSGLNAVFSGMEELEKTAHDLDEFFQIKNWQAITTIWPAPDKLGYNISKIKVLQAHYLDFLFGDFSRAPSLECSILLSRIEDVRGRLTEIKEKCGNAQVKENALDSIQWLKRHHSWLSKLKEIPGFVSTKDNPVIPKVLNNALKDVTDKNSFDRLRAVLRLFYTGILRLKLPYIKDIEASRQEELLCSLGHIVFDCTYMNPTESIIYQTDEFQNTPNQKLNILNKNHEEFVSMRSYLDFLSWYANKKGLSDRWITPKTKTHWIETVSQKRKTPSHNATYNQTDNTRRIFLDFSETIYDLLLDACDKKWPGSNLDDGLEDILPIDVELTS